MIELLAVLANATCSRAMYLANQCWQL